MFRITLNSRGESSVCPALLGRRVPCSRGSLFDIKAGDVLAAWNLLYKKLQKNF